MVDLRVPGAANLRVRACRRLICLSPDRPGHRAFQVCRTARVPGWPMSSHLAASTRTMSNSKTGSSVTVSIMPPTPLGWTTAMIAARAARSWPTSMARPGWPVRRHRGRAGHGSRTGDRGADHRLWGRTAGSRRTTARPPGPGRTGCSRGLPSRRAVARNAIGNHGAPGGPGSPRFSAVMPGHTIAATAAMSGASDSKSRQVTVTVNAARAPGLAPASTPVTWVCEIRLTGSGGHGAWLAA